MKIFFIDVREPEEYAMGHVPGAINIPPAELMSGAKQLEKVDRHAELVLYCKTGSRSNVAAHFLKNQGFSNVINGINKDHVTARYLAST